MICGCCNSRTGRAHTHTRRVYDQSIDQQIDRVRSDIYGSGGSGFVFLQGENNNEINKKKRRRPDGKTSTRDDEANKQLTGGKFVNKRFLFFFYFFNQFEVDKDINEGRRVKNEKKNGADGRKGG